MKKSNDIIAIRDMLNRVIERMECADGAEIREDNHGVREFILNEIMRDFHIDRTTATDIMKAEEYRKYIDRAGESHNNQDQPTGFSERDVKAAHEAIVQKASTGDLEACKYIIEHQGSEDDDGVLFD